MVKNVAMLVLFVCVARPMYASEAQAKKQAQETVLSHSESVTDLIRDAEDLLKRQEAQQKMSLRLPPLSLERVPKKLDTKPKRNGSGFVFFPSVSPAATLVAIGNLARKRKNSEAEEKKKNEENDTAELFPEQVVGEGKLAVVDMTVPANDTRSGASSVSGDLSVSGESDGIVFEDGSLREKKS